MKITPAKLPPLGKRLTGQVASERMGLSGDDYARPEGDLYFDVKASKVSGRLVVKGALRIKMRLSCVRCDEFFERDVSENAYECVREFFDPDQEVDLTDDAREAIILAFPNYPVCSSECRGLCPYCGTNLNVGKCGCKPPLDDRLAVLDKLEVNNGRTEKKDI
ncbi:MAG: DUF177 domain-containing protein [Kiritimatiellia bacterium]